MKLRCPECGSTNVDQYRMLTGAIWCDDCYFTAPEKEKHNPFIVKEKEELFDADPNCNHEIKEKWSGVKCVKCGGWFCY